MTQATTNLTQANPYLETFEHLEKENASRQPSWLHPLRKAGLARFAEHGFPTVNDEDYRFTNVAPIANLPFKPVTDLTSGALTTKEIDGLIFGSLNASRLVFVNGLFDAQLSRVLPQPDGVRIGSLAAALAGADAALVEKHLGRHVSGENDSFAALNTAFFRDGAFIHVPANTVVEAPVHILFIATSGDRGATVHPRNLIIAERGSKLTLMESYVSTASAPYFTNAVDEFVIGEGATVEHCKFQDESTQAYHIAALHSRLERSANFTSHSIAAGGRLSRNNIRTHLGGEGVECILNGLYLTKEDQVADHHMVVEHAKPHCNSHEYFNGILEGRSKGVFHGRILVQPDAQKTDAKQTNKNLLLSDEATVDTKPQLEIYADDVKCTHGATIGQLNEDSIFYLRARGISLDTARRMLIHAFAGEIMDRIKCEPVREELDRLVWDRLEENPALAVAL